MSLPNTDTRFNPTFLLFKHKVFVITFTLIGTIASVVYSFVTPMWYKATVNAVPPNVKDDASGGITGISSALKDFGLGKLGGKDGESYSLMVLLESRVLKDSIIRKYNLPQTYDIPDSLMSKVRKAFEENYEINYDKQGNYEITIWDTDPKRCAVIANDIVEILNGMAKKMYNWEAEAVLEFSEKRLQSTNAALEIIADSLKSYGRRYQIFSPQEQAAAISTALADIKAQEIQSEMIYEIYKTKYGENDPQTQMQKDIYNATRLKLIDITNKPGFAGDFSLLDASQVGIEFMRLYTEFETFAKVKAFLMPTYEKAKLDVEKNLKALYVVDAAVPADKKDRPKRALIVGGAAIGSFVLAVLGILLLNTYREYNENYKKFVKNQNANS